MSATKHRSSNHRSNFDLYDDVEKIKQSLRDATYDVKGKAGEIFENTMEAASEKREEIQEKMSGYLTEKPLKSLGIAMLAGLVIGYFIHK